MQTALAHYLLLFYLVLLQHGFGRLTSTIGEDTDDLFGGHETQYAGPIPDAQYQQQQQQRGSLSARDSQLVRGSLFSMELMVCPISNFLSENAVTYPIQFYRARQLTTCPPSRRTTTTRRRRRGGGGSGRRP
jgi:hypothetical protein